MGDVVAGQDFRVGGVLTRGFSIYSRNIVPFTFLALLINLPVPVISLVSFLGIEDVNTQNLVGAANGILSGVLGAVVSGALVFGAFHALRGTKPSLGAIISRGLATVVAVIIVSFVVSLIVGLGMLLLVVPGVIAAVAYAVAVPVSVVEKPGLGGSLSRSSFLTVGYRWRIFAVLTVFFTGVLRSSKQSNENGV